MNNVKNGKITVLFVLNVIPESVYMAVEEITEKDYKYFKKADGYCINGDEYEEDKFNPCHDIYLGFQKRTSSDKEYLTKDEYNKTGRFTHNEELDITNATAVISASFFM